jgi:hypothetical protein
VPSIIPVGDSWRAQVRRKGHPVQTKTFPKKILAELWARGIEADIDAGRTGVSSASGAARHLTIGKLIERYTQEIGRQKPFGRNKEDVLKRLKFHLGEVTPAELTVDRIVSYITEDRRITGVTASIDLTYLGGVLKVGRSLWRLPVSIAAVIEARDVLRHMNVLGRSNERDRRPTADEIERIRGWLRLHSRSLTPDLVDFIIDSCFRPPPVRSFACAGKTSTTRTARSSSATERTRGGNWAITRSCRCSGAATPSSARSPKLAS